MRISELSRATGVSIPSIKFYVREGLLPSGQLTAPNQADYSEDHERRLRLLRALTDVGGLKLSAVQEVLAAVDDESLSLHEMLGVAQRAISNPAPEEEVEALASELKEVDQFISELGWRVSRDAPNKTTLAKALATLRRMGRDVNTDVFRRYARAADGLASKDVTRISSTSRLEAVEGLVIGTIVFEAALNALRRLAQEHYSSRHGRPKR